MKKKKETERELTLRSQVQVLEAENEVLERRVAELEGRVKGAWGDRQEVWEAWRAAEHLSQAQAQKLRLLHDLLELPIAGL